MNALVKAGKIFLAPILLASSIFAFSGCPAGNRARPPKMPPVVQKSGADDVQPPKKPPDFFPLKVKKFWRYKLTECDYAGMCPEKTIDVILVEKKVIGGKDVFIIETGSTNVDKNRKETYSRIKGSTGYTEDGEFAHLNTISGGKLVDKGIAGKHNLKPGDSWVDVDDKNTKRQMACGNPEFLGLPKDDPAPLQMKAICCRTPQSPDTRGGYYHTMCFSDQVGLVAEYFPNAKSEISTFSIDP